MLQNKRRISHLQLLPFCKMQMTVLNSSCLMQDLFWLVPTQKMNISKISTSTNVSKQQFAHVLRKPLSAPFWQLPSDILVAKEIRFQNAKVSCLNGDAHAIVSYVKLSVGAIGIERWITTREKKKEYNVTENSNRGIGKVNGKTRIRNAI